MQEELIESLVMLACETLDPHHLERLGFRLRDIARDAMRDDDFRGSGFSRGGGGDRGGRGGGHGSHNDDPWDMPGPYPRGGHRHHSDRGGRGGGDRGGRGGHVAERGGRGTDRGDRGGRGGRGGDRGGRGRGGSERQRRGGGGWPHDDDGSKEGLGELHVTSGDDRPRSHDSERGRSVGRGGRGRAHRGGRGGHRRSGKH